MARNQAVVVPRWEFRAFALDFGDVAADIQRRTACANITETHEIYLVVAGNGDQIVKVRGNELHIKARIAIEQGLELWKPEVKLRFPISSRRLSKNFFERLDFSWKNSSGVLTKDAFLSNVAWPNVDIRLVPVFKRRTFFNVGGCSAEITEVVVSGLGFLTIAVEHEEAIIVTDAAEHLGLQQYPNTNYQAALKRLMRISPLP